MILFPFVGDPRECRGDIAFPPSFGPPSTGGASPRFGYATPLPPCPPGPLSYQGSMATVHTYGGAEGA